MIAGVKAGLAIVLAIVGAGLTSNAMPQSAPKYAAGPAEQSIDINRAGVEELLKVPGMTRTWAVRIVRFRPYRSKNELLDRGIVSGEVYGRIREYIIAHREKQ